MHSQHLCRTSTLLCVFTRLTTFLSSKTVYENRHIYNSCRILIMQYLGKDGIWKRKKKKTHRVKKVSHGLSNAPPVMEVCIGGSCVMMVLIHHGPAIRSAQEEAQSRACVLRSQ